MPAALQHVLIENLCLIRSVALRRRDGNKGINPHNCCNAIRYESVPAFRRPLWFGLGDGLWRYSSRRPISMEWQYETEDFEYWFGVTRREDTELANAQRASFCRMAVIAANHKLRKERDKMPVVYSTERKQTWTHMDYGPSGDDAFKARLDCVERLPAPTNCPIIFKPRKEP